MCHEDWNQEVRNRFRGDVQLVNLADVEPLSKNARVCVESAYRRGYCQGFFAGMSDVRPSPNGSRKEKFFFDELMCKWRYTTHQGKLELPPVYRIENNE